VTRGISIAGCDGTDLLSSEPFLLNSGAGSTQPTIGLIFAPRDDEETSVTISCDLSIMTLINNSEKKFVSEPEIETVNMTLQYYNDPLGTPDEALEEKINELKK
jgi:hypothetical protein